MTAALVVVGGGTAAFVLLRDDPPRFDVNGRKVLNPAAVLRQAQAAHTALVRADGASPNPDAACYFAPAAPPSLTQPRVACGPTLLGVGGSDRPWIVGTLTFETADNGVNARFDRFTEASSLDTSDLRAADGGKPKKPAALTPSVDGVRTPEGERAQRVAQYLSAADAAFAAEASTARAAYDSSTRCYFGTVRDDVGRRISDSRIWCGPVLTIDSDPANTWIATPIALRRATSFGTAEIAGEPRFSVRSTDALTPGLELYRPDGRTPPQAPSFGVPDAAPQRTGFRDVLDRIPLEPEFARPNDGVMRTADATVTFEGLARVTKIATGKDAIVAAPGEQLVVVKLRKERADGFSAPPSTATLVIDGRRLAFDEWSKIRDRGYLLLAVPEATKTVDLEVLSAGRTQSISLLTGGKMPGFPLALYRSSPTVGLGRPVDVTIALPKGEPARLTGVLVEARLDAITAKNEWAPPGSAYLSIRADQWRADTPCCELPQLELASTFRLRLPDGSTVEQIGETSSGSTPTPRFVVPEGFTTGRIEITVTATFDDNGTRGQAAAPPLDVPIDIPIDIPA